ncbi:hypothetical protein OG568_09045 [Streptomyces sp. NBC_01450]|uniref:hypothetical protein n=1 Tax=Streptomyces sp. NBC_01450 TaxID=2903871 RepID=UPI002E3544A8|nr:hypothetical protein [Streptomyces sp. NBC_01450]
MTKNSRRAAVAAAAAVALAGTGTGVWAATQTGGAGSDGSMSTSRTAYGPSATRPPGDGRCGSYGPSDWGMGMMGGPGPGMMGDSPYGLAGNGKPVSSLAAAKARAQTYADRLDLRVGEVMQFTCNFYAELTTADGRGATEVLIDPGNGAVWMEYGPAMMWNTDYGMHPASGTKALVSADEARQIARQWLGDHRAGQSSGKAEEFPGYYTLHTLKGGKITGMLSVNATTGQVWYHSWHGDFVDMSDD